MNILLTIVSSVSIFVFGQIILETFIKPLKEFNIIKAKIIIFRRFYANIISNPIDLATYDKTDSELKIIEKYKKCEDEFRKLSCKIYVFKYSNFLLKLFIVESGNIEDISKELMGISNSLYLPYNTGGKGCGIDRNISKEELEKKLNKILWKEMPKKIIKRIKRCLTRDKYN